MNKKSNQGSKDKLPVAVAVESLKKDDKKKLDSSMVMEKKGTEKNVKPGNNGSSKNQSNDKYFKDNKSKEKDNHTKSLSMSVNKNNSDLKASGVLNTNASNKKENTIKTTNATNTINNNVTSKKGTTSTTGNANVNNNSSKNGTLNKGSNKNNKNVIKEDPELLKKREEQVKEYEKYVKDSGLPIAFQLIFSELISKHIKSDNFFTYTAMRLRQIGKEIDDIKTKG